MNSTLATLPAALAGLTVIIIVLWDAFEAIILPRRVTRRIRLTRLFYRATWQPCSALLRRLPPGKKREKYLSFYGPLSLLLLLLVWAVGLVAGFATLLWALAVRLNVPAETTAFGTYLYMSGVTFFTLGFGDITPATSLGRTLTVIEAGVGFGFLAIVIGYLPVLYQAFSRREVNISLLDARAGSPSSAIELLRRHGESDSLDDLNNLLREWERWSSELLESHLSYPLLCYYRSQHDNQSWLASLTTIMDTCALIIAGVDGVRAWQAQLTFAMARHAIVDIAQIFNSAPVAPDRDRLTPEDTIRARKTLASVGVVLHDDDAAAQKLSELRQMYEPYVNALSCHLLMTLPPWVPATEGADNWRTSAWGRISAGLEVSPQSQARDDEHVW